MTEQCCCRGSGGNIAKGSIVGGSLEHCYKGARSIVAYCCRGMGEHCYIQEHCCEQSEVVRRTTLQEEQIEVATRVTL